MQPTVWSLRQRLLIAVMTLLAAGVWSLIAGPLQAADGGRGLSLFASRMGIASLLLVVLAGGVAAGLAAVVAARGSFLQGLFVMAASLTLLAAWTGPMDDWLLRGSEPSGFVQLIVEMMVWAVLMLVGWLGVAGLRWQLIRKLPGLVAQEAPASGGVLTKQPIGQVPMPGWAASAAGALTAVIGGILSLLLIRSSDTGQVVCSLLLAFTVGAGVAGSVVPNRNPLPTLLAPAVVAVLAYAHVAYHFDSHAELLHGWFNMNSELPFNDRMPGPALALPIHYVSAAVTGCLLGLGIAGGMHHQSQRREADV